MTEPTSPPMGALVKRRLAATWGRIDRYLASPTRSAIVVALVLLPIYLSTTNWDQAQVNDTVSTIYPAHQLAFHQTVVFPELPVGTPWFVTVEGGVASNRFIGTILHAVPAYRLLGEPDVVTSPPGALTAVVIATAAMVVLHLVFRRLTRPAPAVVAALVAGLATSTWGISASAMWTHGPGQLWIAVGLLAVVSGRHATAGLAYAVALLARPQNAVIAAVTGVVRGWQLRSLRPVLGIGVTSSLGLAALLVYNRAVFAAAPDERSSAIAGGYGSGPVDRFFQLDLLPWGESLLGMVASPSRGFLVLSPFIAVLVLEGLRPGWRSSPPWVRASALAGLAYLLLQTRVNYFDGGTNQLVYRLPLESLTAWAPLLLLSYQQGIRGRRVAEPLFWAATTVSIGVQTIAAIPWDIAHRRVGGTVGFAVSEWERAFELTGPVWPVAIATAAVLAGVASYLLIEDEPPEEVVPSRSRDRPQAALSVDR